MTTSSDHHEKTGPVEGIRVFETLAGKGETLFRIATEDGLEVLLSSLGANLRSIKWQGRELTLGYKDTDLYRSNPQFLGATVGRFANRIKGGRTSLGSRQLSLACNNGANHLHGGPTGFQVQVFTPSEIRGSLEFQGKTHPARGVAFDILSPDGHEAYPGALSLRVSILIAVGGLLAFHYQARSDEDTLCNITNHAYWNLEGEGRTIHDHTLKMHAASWMEAPGLIPDGTFVPQAGSAFDFSRPRRVGEVLDPASDKVYPLGGKGVDHNFVIHPQAPSEKLGLSMEDLAGAVYRKTISSLRLGAELSGGGLDMEVWTTKPGIQVYTNNFGEGLPGRAGALLSYRGICLETQYFPDSPNQGPANRAYGSKIGYTGKEMEGWDACLKADSTYEHLTLHRWRNS